jgi:pimeloyl-ACP methyl ester carboxylesterase
MQRSAPVDGFSLAYERPAASPSGAPAVLLLHGWPGDRGDWRAVAPQLAGDHDVIVPDLRGFGDSDAHPRAPAEAYAAEPQARGLLALLDELGVETVVAAGYDVGSRVAQGLARLAPERVGALVLAPPLPGAGERVLGPEPHREFWYQHFHRLDLPETLLDGRPDAVRAYLRHFWEHWSGPGFTLPEPELERLVAGYGRPGRFVASIGWYRAGAGTIARSLAETAPDPADRLATPTTVLWPEHDPLFPRAWSDRLEEFFSAVTLQWLDGVGHFSPLEAPDAFAAAIRAAAGTGS